ncbi:hypothetical protein OH76DRAFT_115430 [Lentinus brumalis]|uniref:Uncharacterized protein n=1 Tax=Lentinus brumalis TaxID=2498619 RepID=A0A371CQ12_9APHY|nr:hypothetical protein OH76DRAFT_115430 [Polyporus brumalis]
MCVITQIPSVLSSDGPPVSVVARTGVTLSDFLLVVLTWRSDAVRPIENPFSSGGTRRSLPSILLWNGTLYFIVLGILSALQLSFTLSSILTSGGESFVTLFTEPLTTVLICRFILDLHEATQHEMKLDSDDPLQISFDPDHTPSFVRPARAPSAIGGTDVPSASTNLALDAESRESETSDASPEGYRTTREDWRATRIHDTMEGSSRLTSHLERSAFV